MTNQRLNMTQKITSELNKTLYTSLEALGLSKIEIDFYITSLNLGPTTIDQLAKRTNLARPNAYKIISKLEEKKLAAFSTRKKYARNFIVEPPTKALELLRQKGENINSQDKNLVSILPDLMALYHQGETSTKIKVLQGEEIYLKIFDQILEEARDGGEFFGSTHDFIDFISWEHELNWQKRRIKRNYFIKVLALPSESTNELVAKDAESLRETKILQNAAPFKTSFQLFANKVIIWQPRAPLALLIEDEYIVEMLRSIFYLLWNQAK